MNLSQLLPIKTKTKRRLGQGHGSGRVKTSGRGTKGQKARNSIKLSFEGGALPLIKRLPFMRGKGKNNPIRGKYYILNVEALNKLPKNTVIDAASLVKHGIIPAGIEVYDIKILGRGELTISVTVTLPVSQGARVKIEKAGGTVSS